MEVIQYKKKTIWGTWWEPIRKWFYTSWLIYELSIRFYDYSVSVYRYLLSEHECIATYVGQLGSQALNIICTLSAFAICTVFLTVPAGFILFRFFKVENLTQSKLEESFKVYF